jgi:sigma-B regulation protein RsbU (phosphoserine phosphatase)
MCLIDTDLKTLTLANAGMNKPIILSNGSVEFAKSEGPRYPLGIFKDTQYTETTFNLKTNDLIILTTDGINEAQNTDRELFGEERLKDLLVSLDKNRLSVAEIKDSIIDEVQRFTRKEKSRDDMTVLVVRMK